MPVVISGRSLLEFLLCFIATNPGRILKTKKNTYVVSLMDKFSENDTFTCECNTVFHCEIRRVSLTSQLHNYTESDRYFMQFDRHSLHPMRDFALHNIPRCTTFRPFTAPVFHVVLFYFCDLSHYVKRRNRLLFHISLNVPNTLSLLVRQSVAM